ncbi:MAG: CvpA family protein [Magnetococcales bacterium]|nr:CvpA family protein [Magnetococcales bacterium]
MSILDYVFITVMMFSALWATLRGFFRELVALLGWITAILATSGLSSHLEVRLLPWIKSPRAANYLAAAAVFVGILLVFAVLGRVIKGWVASKGFSLGDRLAGLVFGVLRAGLILILAIAVHLSLDEPASRWTENSILYAYGKQGILAASERLPENPPLVSRLRRMGLNNK